MSARPSMSILPRFGGDVVRGAVGLALFALGGLDVGRLAGQTHIGQLHDALRVDHDVLGLDVAVDQAVGVGVLKRVADLNDDRDRLLLAEKVAVADVVGDRLAFDILHDEVVVPAGLADVDGLDDVRVVELACCLPFLVEPLDVLGVLTEPSRQDLDRDAAVETELLALVHDGHRAGPELTEDLEAGDLRGDGLALFEAGLEPFRLACREVAKLNHQILEHQRVFFAAFLVLLYGSAEFFVRTEPLIHRHPSEQRVVRGLSTHSQSPGPPGGRILSIRDSTSAPIDAPDKTTVAAMAIMKLSAPKSNHFSIILPHKGHSRDLFFRRISRVGLPFLMRRPATRGSRRALFELTLASCSIHYGLSKTSIEQQQHRRP